VIGIKDLTNGKDTSSLSLNGCTRPADESFNSAWKGKGGSLPLDANTFDGEESGGFDCESLRSQKKELYADSCRVGILKPRQGSFI
jgi:hypothetical protein